jgi:hypothetical protein
MFSTITLLKSTKKRLVAKPAMQEQKNRYICEKAVYLHC